jgi:hypothetical protein
MLVLLPEWSVTYNNSTILLAIDNFIAHMIVDD